MTKVGKDFFETDDCACPMNWGADADDASDEFARPDVTLADFRPSMVPRSDESEREIIYSIGPWSHQHQVGEAAAVLVDALIAAGDTFGMVPRGPLRTRGTQDHTIDIMSLVDCGLAALDAVNRIGFTTLGRRRLYRGIIPIDQLDIEIWHGGIYHAFVPQGGRGRRQFPWASRCGQHFVWRGETKTPGSSHCYECQRTTNNPRIYQWCTEVRGDRLALPEWRPIPHAPCRCPEPDAHETVVTPAGLLVPASALPPKTGGKEREPATAPDLPVKCEPICPKTRRACIQPCVHLQRHMPDDSREPKALGLMYRTCGLPDEPPPKEKP